MVNYRGKKYQAVFGPSYAVELADGTLWDSGKPSIDLADPRTGDVYHGLTVALPNVGLGANQVLVCGGDAGLKALETAGVVRCSGRHIHSPEYGKVAVCDVLVRLPFWYERGLPHAPDKTTDRGRDI